MKNVLIVDDNNVNLIMLEAALGEGVYNIEKAMNGVEAVKMATTKKFDIIFMDYDMPIMNGIEATRKIRQIDTKTKIIGYSGLSDHGQIKDFIESGLDIFFDKPKELDELLHYIEKV